MGSSISNLHTLVANLRKVSVAFFTLDRMITILGKLDEDVEVSIDVRPRTTSHAA